MLDREPHKAGDHLTHLCIHRAWRRPSQLLEELKGKPDILLETEPCKQLMKADKV